MLTFTQLSKSFGQKTLFNEISLRLQRGDRVGLLGANGAGKTTLFSIILGQVEQDSGLVEMERGIRIGYLPQESAPAENETVVELASGISPEMAELLKKLRSERDPDSAEYHDCLERFTELDGYAIEAKAKRILSGLAFRDTDFDKPARTLSGGWIMRAHLARLLVMEPDLLMLDEPTNHLDLETLGWFQEQLKSYSGTIFTISHDRAFLDAICNGIAEIRNHKLHRYKGNYNFYLKEKATRAAQYEAAYRNQQREIAQLEDFVRRFGAKATKAAQAQARVKQLKKMERLEAPESEAKTLRFNFPQPPSSGQRVATLNKVTQAYGDHVVYRDLSLKIEKGARIVLVGPNGAGKSTLLKILGDVLPINGGSRELGHNITAGYFSQERADGLNLEDSVLHEALENTATGLSDQSVRDLLGVFLFQGDDVHKKVKVLSGGEKSRLALVKLLLNPPNFILLDEPTTHLDMPSIDALIQALKNYTGTLCFVSHDVHFIRAIASETIQIEAGRVNRFAGDYDYYLYKSGANSERAGLVAGLNNARPEAASTDPSKETVLSARERRRQNAELRKEATNKKRRAEKRVSELETAILKLEEEQSALVKRLEDPTTYSDPEEAKALNLNAARVAKRLEEKNYAWEIAAEELEKLVQTL
ncbi:MAG: ABC-F family ATP-binding cassette domain-containing protein [Verrucomicrobiota bacterium]